MLGSNFQPDPKPPTIMASSELEHSSAAEDFEEFFLISRHRLETEKSLHLDVVIIVEGVVTGSASDTGELDFEIGTVGVDINIFAYIPYNNYRNIHFIGLRNQKEKKTEISNLTKIVTLAWKMCLWGKTLFSGKLKKETLEMSISGMAVIPMYEK